MSQTHRKLDKKVTTTSQKKSDITQKLIIDTAKVFFAEKGYEGTSFRTLAAAANLNHAVISYHFGNKDKLWLIVVEELFKEFIRDCGHLLMIDMNEQTDNRKIFIDCVHTLVTFNAKKPHLLKIGFRESMAKTALIEKTTKILDQYVEMSKTLLDKFQKVGIMNHLSIEEYHFLFLSSVTNRFMIPFLSDRMGIEDPYSDAVIESHTDSIVKVFLKE